MRAERTRWRRLDDMRMAVGFYKFAEDSARMSMLAEINTMLSGPGVPIEWKDLISEKIRQRMEECVRQRDANYRRFMDARSGK